MSSRKKSILLLLIFNVAVISIGFILINQKDDKKFVQSILDKTSMPISKEKATLDINNEAYSYLPDNLKKEIVEKYEEDGTVILTEKNKIKNESYLNPAYIEYMSLPDSKKISYAAVPAMLTNDYIGKVDASIDDATFDLRNVDGINYLNANKNQGSSGLCWSFASANSLETLINKKYGYKINLAEKQLDYVSAQNSSVEGYNPYYTSRTNLNEGGNFYDFEIPDMNGVSNFETSNFAFNTYTSKKNLKDIFDKTKVKYLATGSEELPSYNIPVLAASEDPKDQEIYQNYINKIKNSIYNDGSVYVGVAVPDNRAGSCYYSEKNIVNWWGNSTTVCGVSQFPGHALAIVGWDDDYEYNYCALASSTSNASKETCTGTYISGKGAWILRNSWGSSSSYFYLAYSSYNGEMARFSDAVLNTYDNSYDSTIFYNRDENMSNYKGQRETKFFKGNYNEKLNRINFYTTSANNNYNIYVSTTGNDSDYKLVKSDFFKEYPGIASIDLSDQNLDLANDFFTVKIVSTNGTTTNISNVVAFTNDNVKETEISAKTTSYETTFTTGVTETKTIPIYTHTKNVPVGTTLKYEIYKDDQLVNNITTTNSYIINDKYLASVTVPYNTEAGTYKIVTKYNDTVIDDTATINVKYNEEVEILGNGTESDPYIITNAKQFENIKNNLSSYYRIDNDIDFSGYKNFDPIGIDTPFSGHIIGNNKTIKNLSIQRGDDYTGLFAKINGATIDGINFDNCTLIAGSYTGLVAGDAVNSTIKNITVKNSEINGNKNVSSTIGQGSGLTLENIYNYSNVNGIEVVGGALGFIDNSNVTNIGNNGNVDCSNYACGGAFGYVRNNNEIGDTVYNIKNIYNTGNLTNNTGFYVGGISGYAVGALHFTGLYNTGTIIGDQSVGGLFGSIVGLFHKTYNMVIDNAYTIGKVSANKEYADVVSYEYKFDSTQGYSLVNYKNIYYLNNFGATASHAVLENNTKVKIEDMHDLSNLSNLDNSIWTIHNSTYPTFIDNDFYFAYEIVADDIDLSVGETKGLGYRLNPHNTTISNVTITNKNEDIVSLDGSNVTCNKVGTAVVNIKTNDGTNLSKDMNIECNNPIKSIAIRKLPTKTEYKQFETLDMTGAVLTITYSDNSVTDMDITNDMVTGFDSSIVNNKLTLTVAYTTFTTTFDIKINPLVLTVTYPTSDSYTITGNNSVNYGNDYTFTINKKGNYDYNNMEVLVNNVVISSTNNTYVVKNVTSNLNIVINGIIEKIDDSYNIDVKDTLLNIIPSKATFSEVNKNSVLPTLNITNNYKIFASTGEELNSSTIVLGTGMKIVSDKTYNVVIRGEVTGDGKINQGDVAKLYNHYKKRINIEGLYLEAAKVRGYDDINQGDVAKLYNYYKGKISSLES